MVFFAGQIILHPAMENPTLVVITDRNDLDEQLFGTFSRCQRAAAPGRPSRPPRAPTCDGGSTAPRAGSCSPPCKSSSPMMALAEAHPQLSGRRNIVVIADEAHRSQYDFVDGYARRMREALPNASFIGFTGTPLELADRNTREVFGDYISIYDIARAVEDGATVPIYYEGRLAQIGLDEQRACPPGRRVRGDHRGPGGAGAATRPGGAGPSWRRWWARRSGWTWWRGTSWRTGRRAVRRSGQGDDRVHEPPHRRGAV